MWEEEPPQMSPAQWLQPGELGAFAQQPAAKPARPPAGFC